MTGRVPDREENLARPRKRKGSDQKPVTKGTMQPLDESSFIADPTWHPIATMVWDAALSSGQKDYYQNSDLAILYSICDDLSSYKKQDRRSAQMLASIMSTLTTLLLTEGDRRRVRIELDAAPQEKASLTVIGQGTYADVANG